MGAWRSTGLNLVAFGVTSLGAVGVALVVGRAEFMRHDALLFAATCASYALAGLVTRRWTHAWWATALPAGAIHGGLFGVLVAFTDRNPVAPAFQPSLVSWETAVAGLLCIAVAGAPPGCALLGWKTGTWVWPPERSFPGGQRRA